MEFDEASAAAAVRLLTVLLLAAGSLFASGYRREGRRLYARRGDLEVHVRNVMDRLLPTVKLESRGLSGTVDAVAGRGGVVVGDPAFDGKVALRGAEARTLALATPKVRRALLRLVAEGATLERGAMTWSGHSLLPTRVRRVSTVFLDVAEALREAAAVPVHEALARAATRDPAPGVRRRALEVLVGLARSQRAAGAALDDALRAVDPELRREAAGWLDEAWLWAEIAADTREDSARRADALRRAVRRRGRVDPSLLETVDRFLAMPQPLLRLAALQVLARDGGLPRVARLASELTAAVAGDLDGAWLVDHPDHASAAVAAVVAHDRERSLPLLRVLLDDGPWAEPPPSVLEGLGRYGTVDDVPRLSAFGTAGRPAISRIQSRLGDVGGGRLTLAEGAQGRLSEAQARRGQVSRPEG
jgi:hypothetical protein